MNAEQLERINSLFAEARTNIRSAYLHCDYKFEDDEERINSAVAIARELIARADRNLFNVYAELHKARAENYGKPPQPTTTTRVFTIEDL